FEGSKNPLIKALLALCLSALEAQDCQPAWTGVSLMLLIRGGRRRASLGLGGARQNLCKNEPQTCAPEISNSIAKKRTRASAVCPANPCDTLLAPLDTLCIAHSPPHLAPFSRQTSTIKSQTSLWLLALSLSALTISRCSLLLLLLFDSTSCFAACKIMKPKWDIRTRRVCCPHWESIFVILDTNLVAKVLRFSNALATILVQLFFVTNLLAIFRVLVPVPVPNGLHNSCPYLGTRLFLLSVIRQATAWEEADEKQAGKQHQRQKATPTATRTATNNEAPDTRRLKIMISQISTTGCQVTSEAGAGCSSDVSKCLCSHHQLFGQQASMRQGGRRAQRGNISLGCIPAKGSSTLTLFVVLSVERGVPFSIGYFHAHYFLFLFFARCNRRDLGGFLWLIESFLSLPNTLMFQQKGKTATKVRQFPWRDQSQVAVNGDSDMHNPESFAFR
ncbi:Hypothetical predicted protein, partial [Drosophila guanche]